MALSPTDISDLRAAKAIVLLNSLNFYILDSQISLTYT